MMALVLVTALLLATVVFANLPTGSWRPDIVILTVIAFAFADGSGTGARYGFAAGLGVDLLSSGAQLVGASALVLLLTGYATGALRPYLSGSGLLGQIAVAGVASAAAVMLYGLLVQLLDVTPFDLFGAARSAVVTGVFNAVLAPLVLRPIAVLSERLPSTPTGGSGGSAWNTRS
jgi:rod shape-determining protein MreD